MLKTIKTVGQYTQYVGLGLIFVMAVVGTVAIDIVLLAFVAKTLSESNNRQGNGFGDNPFVTLMLWNMMFNHSSSHHNTGVIDFGLQLLIAPVTTIIAIVLSVLLGVPQVGVALIAGWVVALGVLALGYAIEQAAESAIQYFDSMPNSTPRYSNDVNTAPGIDRTFEFESSFTPVYDANNGPSMTDYYMARNQSHSQNPHGFFQDIPVVPAYVVQEPSAPPLDDIYKLS